MNKVVFTDSRVFMAVVGPRGCGKTRLVKDMLTSHTFYPQFEAIYYLYEESQSLFQEVSRELNIQFIPTVDFQMIEHLHNCLLIFDDNLHDFYDSKGFLKLATSARHRNVHVIYMKHNLFFSQSTQRQLISTQHTWFYSNLRGMRIKSNT